MNGKNDFVTIKVTPDARRMLRVLAADSGKKQWQELEASLRSTVKNRGLSKQNDKDSK